MVLSNFFFFFFFFDVCVHEELFHGIGSDIGVCISKMLKLKLYVMGSALSGKLSCMVTGLVLISVLNG